jgi:hypothetical protein
MNGLRKVCLAGLVLWLTGCGLTTPESPDPDQVVVATATGAPDQEKPTVTKPGSGHITTEPTPTTVARLDHAKLLDQLLFSISSQAEGQTILTQIAASGDTGFVAGLIEIMRFQPGLSQEIGATLNTLTGQDLPPDWFSWVEWAGKHPEIESFDGFVGWKANLLAQIDPKFQRFIYEGVKVAPGSRVEEIEWGGVVVDGIPALDNPKMIDPDEADYLVPHERVFGVSLNGDSRAYPARFLDWHEMFNDIIGGEPVSLAY